MFQALCVGNCIAQQLAADQNLRLIGKTSRGCFLQTAAASAWTIFLTEEAPRGPLTINVPSGSITVIKESASAMIPLRRGSLHFTDTIQLSLHNSPHWQTRPSLNTILPASTRFTTITQTIQAILQRKAATGLTGILPDLLPLLPLPAPALTAGGPFTKKLRALIAGLHASDTNALEGQLVAFLGQGSGLTPSGDDFLIGFFLTLHRWGADLPFLNTANRFGQKLAEEAKHKTTTLSANLIECATLGEADQRLVTALDELMTTDSCESAWLDGLLTWGSSSGMDALTGMILASIYPLT